MLLCESDTLPHHYSNHRCSKFIKQTKTDWTFDRQMDTVSKFGKANKAFPFHSCHGNNNSFMYRNFFDLVCVSELHVSRKSNDTVFPCRFVKYGQHNSKEITKLPMFGLSCLQSSCMKFIRDLLNNPIKIIQSIAIL